MVLKKEHEAPKIEQMLGSKTAWKVLRVFILKPYMGFGLTETAQRIGTSKSNALRVLRILEETNLLVPLHTGKKKMYKANTEHLLCPVLFKILMWDRFSSLKPKSKNALVLFLDAVRRIEKDAVIVFGSVAYGKETERSDIDICLVGGDRKKISKIRLDFLPEHRFEVHQYSKNELAELKDFVVLDALINGIVLEGHELIFDVLKGLTSFPKSYLLYRLNEAKKALNKAGKVKGEARDYFLTVAMVSVSEIDSILHRKTTVPKMAIKKIKDINKMVKQLEIELAGKGDKVWLI